MGYIYLTMNILNDKIYIGRHNSRDSSYLGSGTYFRNAVKKYGRDKFRKVILENNIDDNNLINEREIYWINFFNSTDRTKGYNLTKGGGGLKGLKFSTERRDNMSKAMIGQRVGENHPLYGKPCSKERKDKISIALKGRFTGESSPLYGKGENRMGELNPFYGKEHTQETKDKMKIAWQNPEIRTKRIIGIKASKQKRKERELKPNG